MSINASHIASSTPRVIFGGSRDLEMNGLCLTRNARIPAGRLVAAFDSLSSVGAYFGLDSPERAFADTYFYGYSNKFSAPRSVLFARLVDQPCAGWLRSAPYPDITALKAVPWGVMTLAVDGRECELNALDFSQCASHSDAAAVVNAALVKALGLDGDDAPELVTFSSLDRCFTITSPTTGADSSVAFVGYGDGAPAGLPGFTEAEGAITSPGLDALSPAAQMELVQEASRNWVTFTTLEEPTVQEALAWAAWAPFGYLYVGYTADPKALSAEVSTDLASALKNAGAARSATVYGPTPYAAFLMGAIASIPYNRLDGAITLAFKSQDRLAPTVTKMAQAEALEAKRCNYYGQFATSNDTFELLYPGCMAGGDYAWIDAYVNAIWLNNRVQRALMDGLTRSPRVPYNERGYTQIRAWLMDPVRDALNCGVIEPGIEMDEGQKTELTNEAGLDISMEIKVQGYYIQIKDPGAGTRAQRETPIVNLWFSYCGSIHRIEVASTAIM